MNNFETAELEFALNHVHCMRMKLQENNQENNSELFCELCVLTPMTVEEAKRFAPFNKHQGAIEWARRAYGERDYQYLSGDNETGEDFFADMEG